MKFLHLPKSKEFKLVTRFYDPQKEVLKDREERLHHEPDQDREKTISYAANIRGQFRKSSKHYNSKSVAEVRNQASKRLIYIIIILSALFYFLLR